MPLVRRTRATLRRAEFGFFGVVVYTRVHTPRRWGLPFSAGVLVLLVFAWRPLRTSCWIVGTGSLRSLSLARLARRGTVGDAPGRGRAVCPLADLPRGRTGTAVGAEAPTPAVGRVAPSHGTQRSRFSPSAPGFCHVACASWLAAGPTSTKVDV